MKSPALLLLLFSFCLSAPSLAQEKGANPIATPPPPGGGRGEVRAVVVGISDYQDKDIPDLRFADRDAEAFANFLRSPGGGSLSAENLRILTNQQATAGQVIAALTWLLEESKPGDQAIIYFSGHGDVEAKLLNQLGFLLLWDSPAHVYLAGALPVDMLRQVVSTLSIEMETRVFVVVDACRAGKLAGNNVIGTQLTSSQLAQQFSQEQKVLSCQPNEFSIEGEQWGGGRGVFSYHLCNGLYGLADDDRNGQVSLFEIGRYLEDHVPKDVAPLSQLPLTVGDKSGALFPVDVPTLTALEKQGTPPENIAKVEQRGVLQEALAKADSSVRFWYAGFERTLRGKNFFQPDGDCVEFFFQKLLVTESIAALHPSLKRNYAAALQDDAQQTLNEWLKTSQVVSLEAAVAGKITRLPVKVFTEKVMTYPRCLDRAAELLGSKHYMYAALKARKFFFEGYLLANSSRNPNTELGERALALFRQSLEWQPEQPNVYWQMSEVFGYNLVQPDSLEHYAWRAFELYPNWTKPCAHAAYWYSLENRQLERARPFLEQASRIDSNASVVLNSWAIYYSQQKNFTEAERQLKKAIALDSTETLAWNNLGYLYINTRRYAEAEPVLKKAISLDSTNGLVWSNLGAVYNFTSRYAEAEPVFKKAIALDSTEIHAWNNLGYLYINTHSYAEAEPVLKNAIALDSTHAPAWGNLGRLYINTRRYAEAEPALKKAIALDSTNVNAWNNLGFAYLNTRRYAEAEPVFKKCTELDTTNFSAYNNLGFVYQNTGRYAEAEQHLKKAIVLDSTENTAWYNLGFLYDMTSRYIEAETVFKKAIALDSMYILAWNSLGNLYLNTRRYAEAETIFKKAIALDSTNASLWNGLGFLYLKTKRYAEAEPVFWRIVTADSTFIAGWNNLGNIYRETNRYDESEKMYRKAFALDGNFMPTYRNYAGLKIKMGDLQAAFSYLEQAIQKGYNDYQRMQTDASLAPLREQKEQWEALMKKYFPEKVKD